MVRRQSSTLIPNSSSCGPSGNHSRRLCHKTIEGFEGKIYGQALRAVLRHSLCGSDGRAQKQGVSESAAAQFVRVGPASTNTWRFRVCGSRCWPRPGQQRSHVRAWRRMGVIIAIVEPHSKSHKSAWPSFFLELLKMLEKRRPR